MKCTQCGAELMDGAKFCHVCTAPVAAPAPGARRVRIDDAGAPRTRGKNDAPRRVRTADEHAGDPHRKRLAGYEPRQNDARRTRPADNASPTAGEPRRTRYAENVSVPSQPQQSHTAHRSHSAGKAQHAATEPRRPRYADNGAAPLAPQQNNIAHRVRPADTAAPVADKPRRPRYAETVSVPPEPQPSYNDGENNISSSSQRPITPAYESDATQKSGHHSEPTKKKSKKALWISIIALILVVAILSGTIFIITTVSAKEVQEAKDNYEPPAQAFTLDLNQDDPSNDQVKLDFDDSGRIITCTYTLKDKQYDQRYIYEDAERILKIITSFKKKDLFTKTIPYDEIPESGYTEDDGYIIGTNPASGSSSPAPSPARTVTDASETISDEALNEFLTIFISWYGDYTPYEENEYQNSPDTYYSHHREYDYRAVNDSTQNILTKICTQLHCINWKTYGDEDCVVFDSSVPKTNCPWWTTSEYDLEGTTLGVETFDRKTADMILKNIFNITDKDIETLYQRGLKNEQIWRDQTDAGECYCVLTTGKGGPDSNIIIKDVKTDGKYYYVTYSLCPPNKKDEELATFFAVMDQKEIDGKTYWSLYVNTKDIPSTITPFDPDDIAPAATEAATEASADYKQLYIDYLNNLDTAYKGGKLFYLNDDNIPELAVNISVTGAKAFSYQICRIVDGEVLSADISASDIVYAERSGEITEINARISSGSFTRYSFDGKSLNEEHTGSWNVSTDGSLTKLYNVDGADVSEEAYNSARGDDEERKSLRDDNIEKDALSDYIRNFA